jgi:hypothetical protein
VTNPSRYSFLDLFRGLVVLLMIELLHGITAPAFLFGAGFTFAIASQRRWDQLTRITPAFLRRIWRAVLIILIGYALHLPYFSLTKTLTEATALEWRELLAFDVLQSIGVSLIFLRILVLIVRQERLFLLLAGFFAVAVIYTTPLVWNESLGETLSPAVLMALNGLSGSYFPLFPNAAFLLAGVVVSWSFLRHAEQGTEAHFMVQLFTGGALAIVGSLFLDALPFHMYARYDFWYTSPNYFWMKLGGLAIILSTLWFLESHVRHAPERDIWMPRWLIILGVESLLVYVLHSLLLYGSVLNPYMNMKVLLGTQLSVGESLMAFVALLSSMILAAWGWRYLKKEHPALMTGIVWWMGIVFTIEFLRRPY